MSEVKQYAQRDIMALDEAGNHYIRHVDHMTREKLHSKSDIAAELGWRDMQIAEIKAQRDALAAEREKFAVQCAAAKIAVQYAQAAGFECTLNTPVVDAYLNSVRADAVEEAAESAPWLYGEQLGRSVEAIPKEQLIKFAAKIRAGEPS